MMLLSPKVYFYSNKKWGNKTIRMLLGFSIEHFRHLVQFGFVTPLKIDEQE